MCIEENRDVADGGLGVTSHSRGVIACSGFGSSIGKGPCEETLKVLREASEERNVGLIGKSEPARLDVEGDGSVNLVLIPGFAHDELA